MSLQCQDAGSIPSPACAVGQRIQGCRSCGLDLIPDLRTPYAVRQPEKEKKISEVWLIYFLLISAVQQSDSVIHIFEKEAYTHMLLFHIIFHYSLSQDIEYSPLCTKVGPCFKTS